MRERDGLPACWLSGAGGDPVGDCVSAALPPSSLPAAWWLLGGPARGADHARGRTAGKTVSPHLHHDWYILTFSMARSCMVRQCVSSMCSLSIFHRSRW